MSEVRETLLPGVGVRHEFTTAAGDRVAVLTHRNGRRELAVYDRDDPDSCTSLLHLTADDTRTLNELFGGSQVSEALVAVQQQVEGIAIDWPAVDKGSRFVGATLADGDFRSQTGASIVAIVRGDETIPAPGADLRLEVGDVAVAVGTPDGLSTLRAMLGS